MTKPIERPASGNVYSSHLQRVRPWPDALKGKFRARLGAVCRARGFDTQRLADALEMSHEGARGMLRGNTRPSIPVLIALADKLQVSTDWLLGRRDDPNG